MRWVQAELALRIELVNFNNIGMSSTVEQIKERIDIIDVISSYIKIERSGKHFKARCPFHTEKTPSFFVSPERGAYHCFGCGTGGDIFSFIEEIEGIDFKGALKVLADRAGVTLTHFDPKEKNEQETLYSILEKATAVYELRLLQHKQVGAYLKSRGLDGKTAKLFRIGFAPDEWRAIYSIFKKDGFADKDMIQSGLIIESKGKLYDRFRGRIMFPIMDSSGRVVAFSGRIFEQNNVVPISDQKDRSVGAKYINSPDTQLYNKSRILYGFDKAKMAIRKHDMCTIVEGQFDVVLSQQSGFLNTVAVSGTALSEMHLSLIGRFTKNIVFAFDADEAGIRAMRRNLETASKYGFSVLIAHLPGGSDPADIIQKNSKHWEKYIKNAQHVVEFYLEILKGRGYDERIFHRKIEEDLIPLVTYIESSVEQAHFVKLISEKTGIKEEPIWDALKKRKNTHSRSRHTQEKDSVEKESLHSFKYPEEIRFRNIKEKIEGIFLWQNEQKKSFPGLSDYIKRYDDIVEEPFEEHIKKIPGADKERLIFEAELSCENSERGVEVLKELFNNLYSQSLKIKLVETMNLVKQAEAAGDEKKAEKALSVCHELSQKINEVLMVKL